MPLVINFTYCVSSCWNQFISLTVFFDFFWTVVHYCIVIWINWFFIHISYRSFKLISFCIFIVNKYTTFWFFFQFINISNVLIFFSYFTSGWIWRLQVSLVIYFTYCVVTSWGQLVSLTFELNLIRTIIYNCIVGLINWLIFFISYIWLNSLAFCILIMHVNITFNIRLNKVVVYISWWFNCWWNWVVVWERSVTFQFCVRNITIWIGYFVFSNNVSITPSDQVPFVIPLTSWC